MRDTDELVRPGVGDDAPTPSEVAVWLLDQRKVQCKSSGESDYLLSMCSDWCRENWSLLGAGAEHLRVRAEREGVEIQRVPQLDNPRRRQGASKL